MDARVRLGRLEPGDALRVLCSLGQWKKLHLLIDPASFETSSETEGDLVQVWVRRS